VPFLHRGDCATVANVNAEEAKLQLVVVEQRIVFPARLKIVPGFRHIYLPLMWIIEHRHSHASRWSKR
jgi:hypothetical protein